MDPATPRKPSLTPAVLHPLSLPGFLTHLVSQPSPPQTTVIVCTSRSTFLADLLASLTPTPQSNTQDQGQDQHQAAQPLLPPTLRTLLASQRIRLAFCTSVPALHAYLAAYSGPTGEPGAGAYMARKEGEGEEKQHPVLVLLNTLALLAPTPAFSAQGLGRLVAAGVEAAGRAGARLLVVECVGAGAGGGWRGVVGEGEDVDMELGLDEKDAGDGEGVGGRLGSMEDNPWEQDIPILNVSARRFGSGGGERGWAGRTVKARRVVERWCRFSSLEGY